MLLRFVFVVFVFVLMGDDCGDVLDGDADCGFVGFIGLDWA